MDLEKAPKSLWYASNLGRSLVDAERERLSQLLPELYGPIALQVSRHRYPDMLEASEAILHVNIDDQLDEFGEGLQVPAIAEALPFDAKSIGLVLMPHVLEFTVDPHQVLREASRVLVPEGHLVLLGFNPMSMWGLRSLVSGHGDGYPWNGRYYRLSRVKDWLQLLGFEMQSGEMIYYRPPTASVKMNRRFLFLDKVGDRWWPMMAAVYILIARKREYGITPITPTWLKKKRLSPGLVEPVAKNS